MRPCHSNPHFALPSPPPHLSQPSPQPTLTPSKTAYYLPTNSLTQPATLTPTSHRSFCEYKGVATYHTLTHPTSKTSIANRIWSYENPTDEYKAIRGYLSFYAGGVPWECFVDGEKVQAQEGDFYGGWVTAELVGDVKGRRGTEGW